MNPSIRWVGADPSGPAGAAFGIQILADDPDAFVVACTAITAALVGTHRALSELATTTPEHLRRVFAAIAGVAGEDFRHGGDS